MKKRFPGFVFLLSTLAAGQGSAWASGSPLSLEPARLGDVTFVKPKGWKVIDLPDRMRITSPDDQATIEMLTTTTKDSNGIEVGLDDMMNRVMTALESARVLSPPQSGRCGYRAATVKSSAAGRGQPTAIYLQRGIGSIDAFLELILKASTEALMKKLGGQDLLNTIAHSVSRAAVSQPAAGAIVGLWEHVTAKGFTRWNHGIAVGSETDGTANRYAFGKNHKYERQRDTVTTGGFIQGVTVEFEVGTFENDGATIVFHAKSCVVRFFDHSGTKKMDRSCDSSEFPQAVTVLGVEPNKELVLSGQGLRGGRDSDCDNVTLTFGALRP